MTSNLIGQLYHRSIIPRFNFHMGQFSHGSAQANQTKPNQTQGSFLACLLVTCQPACLLACNLIVCQPACLLASRLACLIACSCPCLCPYLLACLPACLLASLLACLLARVPDDRQTDNIPSPWAPVGAKKK